MMFSGSIVAVCLSVCLVTMFSSSMVTRCCNFLGLYPCHFHKIEMLKIVYIFPDLQYHVTNKVVKARWLVNAIYCLRPSPLCFSSNSFPGHAFESAKLFFYIVLPNINLTLVLSQSLNFHFYTSAVFLFRIWSWILLNFLIQR